MKNEKFIIYVVGKNDNLVSELKNLADDIYLQEAFLVLTDLINLQKASKTN